MTVQVGWSRSSIANAKAFFMLLGGLNTLGVGDDSEEAAQHQIGQTIGIVGVDKVFKPPAIWMMVR
mgnify:CR=1 FL=1